MTCPFSEPQKLPRDGTPLHPSPTLAAWREAGPATPLLYEDGHVGLLVTSYDAARAVLGDKRFSQRPHRTPAALPERKAEKLASSEAALPQGHSRQPAIDGSTLSPGKEAPERPALDDAARASIEAANLLALDGAEHQRMRRGITSRFSVKQVRQRSEHLRERIGVILDKMSDGQENRGQAEIFSQYAQPIAAAGHCAALGVPEDLVDSFRELFTADVPTQHRFDFIREVIARREGNPGEDVITDLLASDFSRIEIEGLIFQIMSAGHDSVAYLITTALVALLRHPDQTQQLREDPTAMRPAIEELMRTGAMFLTLFPRTATEDAEIEGVHIEAGRTVSVSPVGANRDPGRWERPEEFDISRDAFGHLGFGHGPHGCIGQQLARAEISEALSQLLTRFEDLELVEAEQERPLPFANPVATYQAGALTVAWGRRTPPGR